MERRKDFEIVSKTSNGKAKRQLRVQRLVRHFEEYPEGIRPRLRDIRKRKGLKLAMCEYQCRQCGLKMDDTQSDVNDAHTRACCPRCRSEDLRDSDYVPNDGTERPARRTETKP